MLAYAVLKKVIAMAYTGGALKNTLWWAGVKHPANVTQMYLAGESAEYIMAACFAIQQIGE